MKKTMSKSNDHVNPIQEIQFVDMEDKELLELLGFLYEEGKVLTEKMKADPHIQRLEEQLNEYKDEHYRDDMKLYKAKLKAVRAHAKARGLKFNPKFEE